MAEFIEREKALEECDWYANEFCECEYAIMPLKGALENLPAADVVSRGAYDQTDWERCVALTQLKEIGKGLGERMDDVRPVVRGVWVKNGWSIRCSVCGYDMPFAVRNFCPNCGADMREES